MSKCFFLLKKSVKFSTIFILLLLACIYTVKYSGDNLDTMLTSMTFFKFIGVAAFIFFFKPLMEHYIKDNDEYKSKMLDIRNKFAVAFIIVELSILALKYWGVV
ncbi:hypothetical protein [Motilimonas cestriensis]|uniref:hypothetical protein n=1 Tax=Motilimonas cestriensis TaxID=2742685 RepID=UPI003DA2BE65